MCKKNELFLDVHATFRTFSGSQTFLSEERWRPFYSFMLSSPNSPKFGFTKITQQQNKLNNQSISTPATSVFCKVKVLKTVL